MATEKQIAANRANAKRSTGPKTAIGKSRSRTNALRHGLSLSMPMDKTVMRKIDALAHAIAREVNNEDLTPAAREMASAQLNLMRIDKVRDALLRTSKGEICDSVSLRRVAALDRYERYARTKRRRASEQLEASLLQWGPVSS